jgi:hypothetical protein
MCAGRDRGLGKDAPRAEIAAGTQCLAVLIHIVAACEQAAGRLRLEQGYARSCKTLPDLPFRSGDLAAEWIDQLVDVLVRPSEELDGGAVRVEDLPYQKVFLLQP